MGDNIKYYNAELDEWVIGGTTNAYEIEIKDSQDNFESNTVEGALGEIGEKIKTLLENIEEGAESATSFSISSEEWTAGVDENEGLYTLSVEHGLDSEFVEVVCFNADTGYKEFIGVKIINKSEILLIVDEPINAQGVIYSPLETNTRGAVGATNHNYNNLMVEELKKNSENIVYDYFDIKDYISAQGDFGANSMSMTFAPSEDCYMEEVKFLSFAINTQVGSLINDKLKVEVFKNENNTIYDRLGKSFDIPKSELKLICSYNWSIHDIGFGTKKETDFKFEKKIHLKANEEYVVNIECPRLVTRTSDSVFLYDTIRSGDDLNFKQYLKDRFNFFSVGGWYCSDENLSEANEKIHLYNIGKNSENIRNSIGWIPILSKYVGDDIKIGEGTGTTGGDTGTINGYKVAICTEETKGEDENTIYFCI